MVGALDAAHAKLEGRLSALSADEGSTKDAYESDFKLFFEMLHVRQYRLTTQLSGLQDDTKQLELKINQAVRRDDFNRAEKLALQLTDAKTNELTVCEELATVGDQIVEASKQLYYSFGVRSSEDLRALAKNYAASVIETDPSDQTANMLEESKGEQWIYNVLLEECNLNEPRVTDLLSTIKLKVDKYILDEELMDYEEEESIRGIKSKSLELTSRRDRLMKLGISSDVLSSLGHDKTTQLSIAPPPPPSYMSVSRGEGYKLLI